MPNNAPNLTLQELWEYHGFTPNPNQKAAILHTSGPLYLPAGPGSGKTRVLLWRTVNLMVFHDVPPGKIFLSTFTEKAAQQLKEGLRSILGTVTQFGDRNFDLGDMYIGTIHSLCQRLMTDRSLRADRRERPRPPVLLDELGQYFDLVDQRNWGAMIAAGGFEVEMANEEINAIFLDRGSSRHKAVTHCISFFNRLAEEDIEPAAALARLDSGEAMAFLERHQIAPDRVRKLLLMAQAYNRRLKETKKTTFSLVQREAYRVSADLKADAFSHIIIDEYQDTNPIQEKLLFQLATHNQNLCVVGDDDQALYRFRGATVENFVRFPEKCARAFGIPPTTIPLDTNYRSRSHVVDIYKEFMTQCNWYGPDGDGPFRVLGKDIKAHRQDKACAVLKTSPGKPEYVFEEIATLVEDLLKSGKVSDPNQIAFLFPSLKSTQVPRMKDALESRGLQVYAPRAGRFLQVPESEDLFGVLLHIFGLPERDLTFTGEYGAYHDWLAAIKDGAVSSLNEDSRLQAYVTLRQEEIAQIVRDGAALKRVAESNGWDLETLYEPESMRQILLRASGLSEHARRGLNSGFFEVQAKQRADQGRPFRLGQVLNRVTASDWSLLDIFYQLMGFDHFRAMFDLAESKKDEGPICNLSLISRYLGRFVEMYSPIFTSNALEEGKFANRLFGSYLYALYRLSESEYEDADDPFPKGRIPFLTIHQSKGLEFPVVVIANPRRDDRGPGILETMVRPFTERDAGEPLERMTDFDIMRVFYVAQSRAKNLLIFGNLRGQGQRMHRGIALMLDTSIDEMDGFDLASMPVASESVEELPGTYSYTADYMAFLRCSRQYMIFRKYDFTPSQSQTIVFGSLVHRTLDDLHNFLISQREATS